MAVQVKVVGGSIHLVPTTKEVGGRIGGAIDAEVLARDSAIESSRASLTTLINTKSQTNHASTNTTYGAGADSIYGHVRLNSSIVGTGLATVASAGNSGKAADAAHVHPFPTLEELGAAPSVGGGYVEKTGSTMTAELTLPAAPATPVNNATAARQSQVFAVESALATTNRTLSTLSSNFSSHSLNLANPHSVTKSQVGLGNADNTSDANKPVSIAVQAALDTKVNKSITVAGHPLQSNVTIIPTDIGAAPTNHATTSTIYGVATTTEYGHLRITDKLDEKAAGTAITPVAVNTKFSSLDAQIANLQSGVRFYASYWWGKTNIATDITKSPYRPVDLASAIGVTLSTVTVKLFDFTGTAFSYYSASATATSWGPPISILEQGQTTPPNSMQIGITSSFLDIAENTSSLHLAGSAVYSSTTSGWDFFPDKTNSIDNDTIVVNASGQQMVATYDVTDKSIDTADFEANSITARTLHQWTTAFFRKMRGARYDIGQALAETRRLDSTKLNLINQTGSAVYVHDGAAQSSVSYTSSPTPNSIAQRDRTGGLALPTEQSLLDTSAIHYKYLHSQLSALSTTGLFTEQALIASDWA